MAIRKISDLPYLTEHQLDMNNIDMRSNFNRSSFELSYLSAQVNDYGNPYFTYVSRQLQMENFKDLLLDDIEKQDFNLSGIKFFIDGLSSSSISASSINTGDFSLTGNMYCNTNILNNNYTAELLFKNINISASDSLIFSPSAQVMNTVSTDNKSVVNIEFLKQYADIYFKSQLDEILEQLRKKIEELEALAGNYTIDYGRIWPVGSIFMSLTSSNTCPIANLKTGWTWTKITGRYILSSGKIVGGGTSEVFTAGNTVEAGLPQHKHSYSKTIGDSDKKGDNKGIGSGYSSVQTGNATNDIYGKSDTVRPPAIVVDLWRRTS